MYKQYYKLQVTKHNRTKQEEEELVNCDWIPVGIQG